MTDHNISIEHLKYHDDPTTNATPKTDAQANWEAKGREIEEELAFEEDMESYEDWLEYRAEGE